MEYILFLVGLLIGVVIVFFYFRGRSASLEALLQAERKSREDDKMVAEQRLSQQQTQYEKLIEGLKQDAQQHLSELQVQHDRNIANMQAGYKTQLEERLEERDKLHQQGFEQLQKQYEQQLKLLKEQVVATTQDLLKQRGNDLLTANTKQMETLFGPLKEDIAKMERSMNEHREAGARNAASFETTMKQMMERTESIGEQADRLSNALQRKNKTMGNWGELILTELLESQGLQEGVHYTAQQSLKDEAGKTLLNEDTGRKMIPDVVLHLADNRDVVIDAKVSLTAFVDYQNAETEEERIHARTRHLESVRNHIKELATKQYANYIVSPRVSSDFVIMFVPNEGALQLALASEPHLWREAFDKKVFLVGGQTLIAALRIIDLTWVNVQQERNTRLIMEEARKLIDRVSQFVDLFDKLGRRIAEAHEAYDKVVDKVKSGRQSILGAGRNLEDLGVRGKKSLPTHHDD